MKVAVVLFGYPPEAGGGFTFQHTLVETLRAMEAETAHRFVYYAFGESLSNGTVPVIQFPTSRRSRATLRLIELSRHFQDRFANERLLDPRTWFERSLAKNGVELVWFAANFVEECDQPFIFTLLDLAHLRQPWFPEVSSRGEWERRHRHFSRFLPKATRIIVPNEAGAEELLRNFPVNADRVLILHHPTPAFALEAAEGPTAPTDVLTRNHIRDPYLFYPAQFWAHKNHVTLLEMLAELNMDANPFQLVCVGSDRGQLDHVKELVSEFGLSEHVRPLGFVGVRDLVALYQHAYALVYASFFGPENLPPLEAFALGCPVVCADVPGAREQFDDAALLVPPADPAAYADAVRRLGDPRLRAKQIEAGRRQARKYTPRDYVQGVLDFLDEFERTRRSWS